MLSVDFKVQSKSPNLDCQCGGNMKKDPTDPEGLQIYTYSTLCWPFNV